MKLLQYTFVKSKYYRDNQEITEAEVKSLLNKAQYEWLLKTGKCRTRAKKLLEMQAKQSVVDEPIIEKPIKKKKTANDRLLAKYKNEYKTSVVKYRDGFRTELWRFNKKGFYNVIGYVNEDDIVDDLIIADIKAQKSKKTNKEDIAIENDDE